MGGEESERDWSSQHLYPVQSLPGTLPPEDARTGCRRGSMGLGGLEAKWSRGRLSDLGSIAVIHDPGAYPKLHTSELPSLHPVEKSRTLGSSFCCQSTLCVPWPSLNLPNFLIERMRRLRCLLSEI